MRLEERILSKISKEKKDIQRLKKYNYNINFSDLSGKKYYLYRHIRPDKNEPFYIGIGTATDRIGNNKYSRALCFNRRNGIWKKILNKNNQTLEVDIVFETDSLEELLEKEIEFIKLYGRIDLGTGILANLTNGGYDRDTIKVIHKKMSRGVCLYDRYGNLVKCFDSGEDCRRFLNVDVKIAFSTICNPKNNYSCYGYYVRYKGAEFNENIKKIDVKLEGLAIKNNYKVLITDESTGISTIYDNINIFCKQEKIKPEYIWFYERGRKNRITGKTYKFQWL